MSKTLTLLCFKQSRLFPEDTAHWALYLWDADVKTGTLFHATKQSITTGRTYYKMLPLVDPTSSKSLQASVEIASGITLNDATLDMLCKAAAKDRPFDLAVNNCQRFCTQILQRLVNNAIITQEQFDALEAKGFKPIF